MIIYGYSTRVGKPRELMQGNCPECGKGPLAASTLFRYFHIYWIPLFPFSRKLTFCCSHCQKAFFSDDLKDADRFGALAQARPDRVPLHLFAGSVLIALFVAWIAYADREAKKETLSYLQQPQQSDLYVVKMEKPVVVDKGKLNYTVLRLVDSSAEEAVFQPSSYGFSDGSTAKTAINKELTAPDAFEEEQVSIPRASLEQMLKSGRIYTIVRGKALPQAAGAIKVGVR